MTIAELAALDARPIKDVLRDAVRLGDVAMRDLESAIVHGETGADVVGRLLEACRYVVGLATAGLSAGLPLDRAPGADLVTVDSAAQLVAEATMAMTADLVCALLPVRTSGDVIYRDRLLIWARDRMAAAVQGDAELPPLPTAPIVAETVWPGRDQSSPEWRSDTGTIDVEVLDDDDVITEEDQVLLDEYRRLTGREWVDAG